MNAACLSDAIIISDIHLGSGNCQAKILIKLLNKIIDGKLITKRLILNGDMFDSYDFRRLNKTHWKILSLIRKLSDQIEIIWICGNHDGSAEIISHLLGVSVMDEYIFKSGNNSILILHGHTFDDFITAHPIMTWIADCIYAALQWIDGSHTMARMAKHGSKSFMRCAKKIEDGAIKYAKKHNCNIVCCGHTHFAVESKDKDIKYYNSGSWTECPCSYLTISYGSVKLHYYDHLTELNEIISPKI